MDDPIAELAAQQAKFWNSPAADKWIDNQAILDRQMTPLTDLLFEDAAIQTGERVIDVGCGAGTTSRRAGQATGSNGSVLGVDLSEPLVETARKQTSAAHVRFASGDAGQHAFDAGAHDLVLSRFGVMFFADPVAAFLNLRQALKPGGRICFVCWGEKRDNPWFQLPVDILNEFLEPLPPTDPRAPGPTALGDPTYIDEILASAGFQDRRVVTRQPMLLATGSNPAETAGYMVHLGPVTRQIMIRKPDESVVQAVIERLTEELVNYATDDGIQVPSSLHYVQARNPS